MTGKRLLLAAAVAACFLFPTSAQAHWPYAPYGGFAGYGGFNAGYVYPYFYRVRSIPTPPYFALHPPVYYGPRLIMRPYGNSPFAYPSGYERQEFVPYAQPVAEIPQSQPQLIINPYVPQGTPAAAPTAQPAQAKAQPNDSAHLKIVFNPHVAR
jgi:hypothetical protein